MLLAVAAGAAGAIGAAATVGAGGGAVTAGVVGTAAAAGGFGASLHAPRVAAQSRLNRSFFILINEF